MISTFAKEFGYKPEYTLTLTLPRMLDLANMIIFYLIMEGRRHITIPMVEKPQKVIEQQQEQVISDAESVWEMMFPSKSDAKRHHSAVIQRRKQTMGDE